MTEDAPPNGGAPPESVPVGNYRRVSEMQAKLHRWAAADVDRRFDDLFNFVYDPATLAVAFDRVATNRAPVRRDRMGSRWPVSRPRSGSRRSWTTCALNLKVGSSNPNRCGNARFPN